MAELKTMYPAQANTPETTLAGALTTSDTSVTVLDGSILPDAPNLLTIGADTNTAETVLMTAKDGNVLTIERGYDGTSPRSWTKGDIIGRYFTAADQTAIQENIKALDDGYIEKPASPVSGNFAAFDGTTGAVKDSGKKAADFAAASHSHAGYAEVKIFQNVTVAASAWANSSTYAGYPFAAVISCAGVTAEHVPEVTFGVTEATGGNFAPVALSGAGTVTIYAAEKPGGSITLPVIKCEKAV